MEILRHLVFFNSDILHVYTGRPDKYHVEFGHYGRIGGEIYGREINIRFALRELPNNELAVAVFIPDLLTRTKEKERLKWKCFELHLSEFENHPDPDFDEWIAIYLKENDVWPKQEAPLKKLIEHVNFANAITRVAIDCSIFSFAGNELRRLLIPLANHTHAYEDAHRELYRYFIDGIDKKCLKKLNAIRNVEVANIDEMRSFKAFMYSFPHLNQIKIFEKISEQRAKSVHERRITAEPYPALKKFLNDLEDLAQPIELLVNTLERELSIGRNKAMALDYLPNFKKETKESKQLKLLFNLVGKKIIRARAVVLDKESKIKRDALILKFENEAEVAITLNANTELLAKKEALHLSDLAIEFIDMEINAAFTARVLSDENLESIFLLTTEYSFLKKKLSNIRIHEIDKPDEVLPRRYLLFLDFEDGSSLVLEPTWNIGHKVKNGIVHLHESKSVHLQMIPRFIYVK